MKKNSQRAQRVGDQIQRELADLLRLHLKDPRIGMVTITAVEVTPDLSHAKIFFTHLAGVENAPTAVEALPQLHFVYDDSTESGLKISKLIDAAIADDRKHPST